MSCTGQPTSTSACMPATRSRCGVEGVQCSAVQCSLIQADARLKTQCGAVQCRAVQCSAQTDLSCITSSDDSDMSLGVETQALEVDIDLQLPNGPHGPAKEH